MGSCSPVAATLVLFWILGVSAQERCGEAEFTLRLAPTFSLTSGNAGRLEMCVNGEWGTVSGSSTAFWSAKNVLVACRQLGFDVGLNSIPFEGLTPRDRAEDTVPVHFRDVSCDGTEFGLTNCTAIMPSASLSHDLDIFIACLPMTEPYSRLHTLSSSQMNRWDFRLVGNVNDNIGIVEVASPQGPVTICPDRGDWNDAAARSVCQYLGFETGVVDKYCSQGEKDHCDSFMGIDVTTTRNSTTVGRRSLYEAECGNLDTVLRLRAGLCTFLVDSATRCQQSSTLYAGVRCMTTSQSESVRLSPTSVAREGDDTIEGIVEILYDQRWGFVCAPGDEETVSASTVCQHLGYRRGDAELVENPSGAVLRQTESRLKPIWLQSYACDNEDEEFTECSFNMPLNYGNCPDTQLFKVKCRITGGLSGGAVAGIVIGTFVGVAIICGLFKIWDNNKKRPSGHRPHTTPAPPVSLTAITSPSAAGEEVEPEPEPELPERELTEAPPPSYQAATTFPSVKPTEDEKPPPYPGNNEKSLDTVSSSPPPGPFPPEGASPYPSASPYPPPTGATPYPPSAAAPAPPETATPYPVSLPGEAIYPPSSGTGVTPYPPPTADSYPPPTAPFTPPGTDVSSSQSPSNPYFQDDASRLAAQAFPPPPNAPQAYSPPTHPVGESYPS